MEEETQAQNAQLHAAVSVAKVAAAVATIDPTEREASYETICSNMESKFLVSCTCMRMMEAPDDG